ncbi:MAG: DUF3696 domain-containing protein, partial [Candidatus Obscuribacterales bacterium]|nr:DUF3696 domain-containing protein [Candidatus Obscuribacterales bacterium]
KEFEIIKLSLEEAVSEWLKYLDVADHLNIDDYGKHGYGISIKMKENEFPQDISQVGFGVSQVLPVVVLGLLAEAKTTLLFEQPELHLHPKVQARLADFFFMLALTERQCLVETHSEYMISKLRLSIAECNTSDLSAMSQIYFTEKVNGRSKYTKVMMNEFGAVIDWPAGFFDESLQQSASILNAAVKKRQLKGSRKK